MVQYLCGYVGNLVGTDMTTTAQKTTVFTALVWFPSNAGGKREVKSSWWVLFMALTLYLLSYYWAVASGHQTAEMKELEDSGNSMIPGEKGAQASRRLE